MVFCFLNFLVLGFQARLSANFLFLQCPQACSYYYFNTWYWLSRRFECIFQWLVSYSIVHKALYTQSLKVIIYPPRFWFFFLLQTLLILCFFCSDKMHKMFSLGYGFYFCEKTLWPWQILSRVHLFGVTHL